MSFRDFQFPGVVEQFALTLSQSDLFDGVEALDLPQEFADRVADGEELASDIATEKAKSEFIIAPILQELRRAHRKEFSLFSGVSLDVDASRGLVGVCDFLLSRSPIGIAPTAPLLALVEAKNDLPKTGLGQCVASMVAMWEYNLRSGKPLPAVFGAATSGTQWRFARLVGADLTIDESDYHVSNLGKIFGILASIVRKPAIG